MLFYMLLSLQQAKRGSASHYCTWDSLLSDAECIQSDVCELKYYKTSDV